MIFKHLIDTANTELALWDIQHARTDGEGLGNDEFDELLEADALGGRLFVLRTGSHKVIDFALYVDEAIPEAQLDFYKTLNRRFLLRCPSGRVTAGDTHAYTHGPEDDSAIEPMRIPPGDYELQLHELCEGDLGDPVRMVELVGKQEYDEFLTAEQDWPWGCASLVAGLAIGWFAGWLWALPIAALGYGWAWRRRALVRADPRLREITERIEAHRKEYPYVLFTLRRRDDPEDLKGGWHSLSL